MKKILLFFAVVIAVSGCSGAPEPLAYESEIELGPTQGRGEYLASIKVYSVKDKEKKMLAAPELLVAEGRLSNIFTGDLRDSVNVTGQIRREGSSRMCQIDIEVCVDGTDTFTSRQILEMP